MIQLEEFRKLLGPEGASMTDEEVLRIRTLEYKLAGIIFEMWLQKRNQPRS
jgi:hypothetical protein